MKKVLRLRPSPAMIIAIIALVAALGGTAIAGGVLTTKKFKNQAVRGPLTYVSTTANLPALTRTGDGLKTSSACPVGTHVTAGGAKVASEEFGFVNDSYPTASGWTATTYNFTSIPTQVTVTAICATVKNVSGSPPG